MMRNLVVVFLFAVASGCSSVPLDPMPVVKDPGKAATVKVERPFDVVGAPATMFLYLEDRRVYPLKNGASWTFKIDQGLYRFGYNQGFNVCRQRLDVKSNQTYYVRLTPVCKIKQRPL